MVSQSRSQQGLRAATPTPRAAEQCEGRDKHGSKRSTHKDGHDQNIQNHDPDTAWQTYDKFTSVIIKRLRLQYLGLFKLGFKVTIILQVVYELVETLLLLGIRALLAW
jgi:hypothetical protein